MRNIVLTFFIFPVLAFSQDNKQADAARIKVNLKKLNFLGSVLYVAAHPDDENTRIITAMANGRLAATAYLSMTRGDGGQNLIGPELRDLLGLIRTQELLTARKIDGGQQFFTRANDFGYSKSADETLQLWGKDQILSDVVKVFRQFQPDIIITRFPPTKDAGHGHHTASAMLAQEAFDLAAKADVFPEQVKEFGTWQPKAIYTNTGRWWNNKINENTPGILTLDVGGYSALLGESYSEIAARSRSQHKSQGFGSRGTRGYQPEFLEFVKGDKPEKDIFENINTTWGRVKAVNSAGVQVVGLGGNIIQVLVEKAIKEFNMEKPVASIPILLQIRKEISNLGPDIWRTRKLAEVEQLIQDCLGLYISATADHYWMTPGQNIVTTFELTNRSGTELIVERIQASDLSMDSVLSLSLADNVPVVIKSKKIINSSKPYTDPYWLREPHGVGLFTVNDPMLIGKPENDPAINFTFALKVGGESLTVTRPLLYKETDPVKGEVTRPLEIVPPVFLNLSDPVLIFNDENPREVKVLIKSSSENMVKGELRLELPDGWRAEPVSVPFELAKRDDEQTKSFTVFPSKMEMTSSLRAVATIDGKVYDHALHAITYDHIPAQTLLPKAEAKVVRLNLKKEGEVIGYIKGAGDDIPTSLRNIGYQVWEMKNEEVTAENLKRVDAIVLGIRALNTNDRLPYFIDALLDYVKQGGTMVVQYNTNFELEADKFSPYPITLSRDRVTEENAEVRILKPDHPLLNTPNRITSKDFEGWVQERGLYFPSAWDLNYETLLSMNDKNENPHNGSLLVAKYGEGYYVYTGLSFFRELPEGVAGAYKLFANIVSLGKPKQLDSPKAKRKTR